LTFLFSIPRFFDHISENKPVREGFILAVFVNHTTFDFSTFPTTPRSSRPNEFFPEITSFFEVAQSADPKKKFAVMSRFLFPS